MESKLEVLVGLVVRAQDNRAADAPQQEREAGIERAELVEDAPPLVVRGHAHEPYWPPKSQPGMRRMELTASIGGRKVQFLALTQEQAAWLAPLMTEFARSGTISSR